MSRVNELRQTIVASLEANADLSELKSVGLHGGRFTIEEVKRLAAKAPAVVISCLEIPAGNSGTDGDDEHQLKLIAYVITKDEPALPKDESSIAIVEKLLRYMKDEEWELKYAQPAQNFIARNLYSSKLDSIGVSLWGVGFDQTIQLECC